MVLEGWQDLLHGQLEQDFQIANLSSCQREGWQDLLHGQLEQDFQIANLSSCQREGWQDLTTWAVRKGHFDRKAGP